MKYIAHGSGGDADCMSLAEGPAPVPGPGQILIEVVCAGVNRPDVLQRSGRYPPRRTLRRCSAWKWRAASRRWARA